MTSSSNLATPLTSQTVGQALKAGGNVAQEFDAFWAALQKQPYIPAALLELCRLRLAQMHRATEEVKLRYPGPQKSGLTESKIATLLSGQWEHNPAFTPEEVAVLIFAEMYGMDPASITDEQADEVKKHFGEPGLVALIQALGIIDARIRLSLVFNHLN